MPITLDTPISVIVPVVTQESRSFPELFIYNLYANPRINPANPPGGIDLIPYDPNGGHPIFAPEDQVIQFRTYNIYAAAQNIPEIGTMLQAAFAVGLAWKRYCDNRQTDLDNSQADYDSKKTDLQNAIGTLDQAKVALSQVPIGQDSSTELAAVDSAQNALTIAQENFDLSQTNLSKAILAHQDPANPKI